MPCTAGPAALGKWGSRPCCRGLQSERRWKLPGAMKNLWCHEGCAVRPDCTRRPSCLRSVSTEFITHMSKLWHSAHDTELTE